MAHISEDRVLETGTGNTTVSFTLSGAVAGFRTFTTQLATNDTCWYCAWAVNAQGEPTGAFENGLGTLTASTTLTRTTILESSNSNTAVTFSGTLYIAIGLLASRTVQLDNLGVLTLPTASAEPASPSAGNVYLYSREIIPGNTVLKIKRPSGIDSPIQDSLIFNRTSIWRASAAAITAMGAGALTTVGTLSAGTNASGSAKSQGQKIVNTSAGTAGALASAYANNVNLAPMFRGNVAGEGGFRVCLRFSLQTLQSGNRGFFGLADVVTAPTNVDFTTNTTPGKIGLAFNANTGNWRLINNITGTAPTTLDLGANFPLDTASLMELCLFCRPHNGTSAGNIGYRIRRYTTSSADPAFETSGTLSTNIPAATTLLHVWNTMTNNATAAAVAWTFHQLGIDGDW